jgi:transcription antitermination factor NusG
MAVAYFDEKTMALVQLETKDPSELTLPAAELPWFALQVRSRRESLVADYLGGKGYELFLPLQRSRRQWTDRIKDVEVPLFPGYLFCQFDPQNRLPILKTPWVIRVVGFNHIPTPVEDAEINAIRTLVASGVPSQQCSYLGIGDIVRIESGPLRGLKGVLSNFKGNRRLVVSITLLQRSVAVEIDSALVTPECSGQALELVGASSAVGSQTRTSFPQFE